MLPLFSKVTGCRLLEPANLGPCENSFSEQFAGSLMDSAWETVVSWIQACRYLVNHLFPPRREGTFPKSHSQVIAGLGIGKEAHMSSQEVKRPVAPRKGFPACPCVSLRVELSLHSCCVLTTGAVVERLVAGRPAKGRSLQPSACLQPLRRPPRC